VLFLEYLKRFLIQLQTMRQIIHRDIITTFLIPTSTSFSTSFFVYSYSATALFASCAFASTGAFLASGGRLVIAMLLPHQVV
jgi:hypothetical protein